MTKVFIVVLLSLQASLALAKLPSKATVFIGRGEMMTHEQFMQLNHAQKVIYIKAVRRIFSQLPQKSDFFSSREDLRSPFFELFFERANADGNLRCMYGGFVLQSPDCVPVRELGEYRCEQGQALCNPDIFGDGGEGETAGSGICVTANRTATLQCDQRAVVNGSRTASVNRAVAIVGRNRDRWNTLSGNFNNLCGSNSSQYIRPGLGQRSIADIGATCTAARAQFASVTAELGRATPAPEPISANTLAAGTLAAGTIAVEPAPIEPAPVAPADPPRSLTCRGQCKITVSDVSERGTGGGFLGLGGRGRVNAVRRSTYRSDACEIAIEAGSGGRVDMRNLPADFPQSMTSMRMRNVPCADQERCRDGAAHASGSGYDLYVRSAGRNKCELEFLEVGPDADGQVAEIVDDQMGGRNQQKCMGLDRNTTLSETDLRVSSYRSLTQILARQGCDLSKIDVVRSGTDPDWNGSQSALFRDCRLRMSPNVDPNQRAEIRFRPNRGEALTIEVPNLGTGFSEDQLLERLRSEHICFASWQERLAYRESQRGNRRGAASEGSGTR